MTAEDILIERPSGYDQPGAVCYFTRMRRNHYEEDLHILAQEWRSSIFDEEDSKWVRVPIITL